MSHLKAHSFTFLLGMLLAACSLAPQVSKDQAIVTPQVTLTSVFEPMLTPTATPYEDKQQVEPPPAAAITIPALVAGEAITPTWVDFIDGALAWGVVNSDDPAVSGHLLRSTDSASTWQGVTPPSGYPTGSRFYALDGLNAWAAPAIAPSGAPTEAGYTWRTSDGGQSWQASQPLELMLPNIELVGGFMPQGLYFLDAQHGWLVTSVGHYMNQDVLEVFSTQDGGQTWQRLADKYSMGQDGGAETPCHVSGVAFVDASTGFLAGDCLAVSLNDGWSILVTRDGGRSWARQQLPQPAGVPEAVLSGLGSGQAFCAASGVARSPAGILVQYTCLLTEGSGMLKTYPFLFLSPDGGQSWRGWDGESASFVDARLGYALGALQQDGSRALQVTLDGGLTWQVLQTVTWPGAQLEFIPTSAGSTGYVLASAWNAGRSALDYALVRSQDGGLSWELVQSRVK